MCKSAVSYALMLIYAHRVTWFLENDACETEAGQLMIGSASSRA